MHDIFYGKRWEAQVKKEKEWVEVDWLQDVCQQLRTETEERDFIEDDIRRTRPTQQPTLQMYSHLRKIIAHSDTFIENGALDRFMRLSFVQFCERNPHITVIVRLNCTYDDGWMWLGMHYATCVSLRGSGVEVPDQFRSCWQRLVDWLRYENDIVQKRVPANYRLTLTNSFKLRHEDFGGRGMNEEQVNALMVVGRKMFEEGCWMRHQSELKCIVIHTT
jgi:hypothetical protein